MRLQPQNINELGEAFARAGRENGRIESIDLAQLNRVLDYAPEDMTITVEAGMTLDHLQSVLRANRQWLPLDPPPFGDRSLDHLLAWNLSGPRRFGFGTARDYLIGARIVLGDGTLIKAGGKVVKNVAGYDLCKLFIGARQTLGIIVEASFKLRPLPEREELFQTTLAGLDEASQLIEAIFKSDLTPHVLDLHNLSAPSLTLVLGFAGSNAEVEYQKIKALQMAPFNRGTLAYNDSFWPGVRGISVMPSKIFETIRKLGSIPWISRAGDGVIFYKGDYKSASEMPVKLMRRLKMAYDPKGVLPSFPE